jgi:hypothetical protein
MLPDGYDNHAEDQGAIARRQGLGVGQRPEALGESIVPIL